MDPLLDMKRAWDARAKENARFYIATAAWKTEEEFEQSGSRDASQLFTGLEHLLTPDSVVLDIGCGIGRMDRHIAARVGRLVGIDISPEMVRLARQRLTDVPNVQFIEGDGTTLHPLRDGEFDLVFSFITFQHLSDPVIATYVRECARVLRRGGHFVFQVVESEQATRAVESLSAFLTRFHAEAAISALLASNGFAVLSIARETIQTEVMPCTYARIDAVRGST